MNYQPNINGTEKRELVVHATGLMAALRAAHFALNSYRGENLHGRNYQTRMNPQHDRMEDLATVAGFRDTLDDFTREIEDDLKRLMQSTGT